MSVFLTPELKPFWGGTYLPHDDFMELCTQVTRVYRGQREDLFAQSRQIAEKLNQPPRGPRTRRCFAETVCWMIRRLDPT